ncbi:hypothetical protein PR048_028215 [Dryococelus australis]|uniref:Uncharacterized protein n=1 Tax=Dryococelus australis TaxID=614101 RepID=A0ABQ9GIM2_9NEOP|nr:hypothetical protein PR048_028215 [Dryococelus australis]
MKGRGKWEIPEETRLQVASSGTIPTCENPGATPPGIKPGSQRFEARSLTTTPPRPHEYTCLGLQPSFLLGPAYNSPLEIKGVMLAPSNLDHRTVTTQKNGNHHRAVTLCGTSKVV